MFRKGILAPLVITLLVGSAATGLMAQDQWTGSEGASWFVDSNWTSHVPTSSAFVEINNRNTAVIDQANAELWTTVSRQRQQ